MTTDLHELWVRKVIADEGRILRESFDEDIRQLRLQMNLRPPQHEVKVRMEDLERRLTQTWTMLMEVRDKGITAQRGISDLRQRVNLLDHFTPKTQKIRRPVKVLFDDGSWEDMD